MDLWAKQDGGANRAGEKDGRGLDASISVIRYHPLFAHQTQHLCVVLVFMSELITGRQLPDEQLEDGAASQQCAFHPTGLPDL